MELLRTLLELLRTLLELLRTLLDWVTTIYDKRQQHTEKYTNCPHMTIVEDLTVPEKFAVRTWFRIADPRIADPAIIGEWSYYCEKCDIMVKDSDSRNMVSEFRNREIRKRKRTKVLVFLILLTLAILLTQTC